MKQVKLVDVLKFIIIFLIGVFIFVDGNVLNSMFIVNDTELLVEEVVYSPKKEEVSSNSCSNLSAQVLVNNVEISSSYMTVSNVASSDYWAWPTDSNYVITSYFGSRWGSYHDAIDISGTGYGSSIFAANNGVVTDVKGGCVPGDRYCNGRGGNYIVINHNSNNYYTVYMHLKDVKVSVGQVVSRGQIIGTMGNTGNVVPMPTNSNPYGGTHLHFALFIGKPFNGGYAVNPMNLY